MKTTKLENLRACGEAIEYVKTQKSSKDAWMNCSRGDWMLWLAKRLGVDDRKLTLAKASCANQVRHLMKDQRSLDAIDACYRYANGEISREELNTYAADAAYAAAAYAAAYAAAAAYASDAAAYAASYASDAYAAYAYASASAAAASAADAYAASASASASKLESFSRYTSKLESLKKSADICREILTEDVLMKYKKLK